MKLLQDLIPDAKTLLQAYMASVESPGTPPRSHRYRMSLLGVKGGYSLILETAAIDGLERPGLAQGPGSMDEITPGMRSGADPVHPKFVMSLNQAIECWNRYARTSYPISGDFRWEQFTRRDGGHWAWMPETAQLKPHMLPAGTTAEDLQQGPWVQWLQSQRPHPLVSMEF